MQLKLLYIQTGDLAQQKLQEELKLTVEWAIDLTCLNTIPEEDSKLFEQNIDLVIFGLDHSKEASERLLALVANWPEAPKCIVLGKAEFLQDNKLPLEILKFPIFSQESFNHENLSDILRPIAQLKESDKEKNNQSVKEKNAFLVQTLEALDKLESFQKAMDAHALVAVTDKNGHLLYVNDFLAKTSGYDHIELIGKPISLLQPELKEKGYPQEVWNTIKQGNIWHGEQKKQRKDGSHFWVKCTVSPSYNESNGELISYINMFTDISSQKASEKELTDLLIRFELAIKTNKFGIWDFDLRTNKLIWDDNMFSLYDLPGKTEINWDEWAEMLEPKSLAKTEVDFAKALVKGSTFEATFKKAKNGGYKSIASVAKIIRDSEGSAIRAIGLNWDITKTIEYEEKLEASLKEKEDILDSIHDGFLILNSKMEVLSINKSACQILDVKEEELIGNTLWPEKEDQKSSDFYPTLKRAMDTQVSTNVEGIDRVSKNWIRATAYPKGNGLVIFFKDITVEKIKSMELEKVRTNQLALINTTRDLIWSLNTKLELVAFNDQFCQHQISIDASHPIEGSQIFNKHSESYKSFWIKRYMKALAGDIVKETIKEKDISFSLAIYPIINADNLTEGIACYARDITDMEAYINAIQLQNNELKDIAWMQSHIVRAPVARILGLVELIHDENLDLDHTLKGYLNSIDVSAQELDSIIEKISEKTHSAKIKGI